MDIGMKGGEKLLKRLADINRALGQANHVEVGFLSGSTAGWNGPRPMKPRKAYASAANYKKYHAVAQSNNSQGSNQPAAYIASIMEYGDAKHNIPPRPFFSTMIRIQSKSWPRFLLSQFKRLNYDSRQTLELMGLHVKEQLQFSILNGEWAANAPGTILAKGGNDVPLIDSHNMLNAVDYVVTK
jgi:hypothetical protein